MPSRHGLCGVATIQALLFRQEDVTFPRIPRLSDEDQLELTDEVDRACVTQWVGAFILSLKVLSTSDKLRCTPAKLRADMGSRHGRGR